VFDDSENFDWIYYHLNISCSPSWDIISSVKMSEVFITHILHDNNKYFLDNMKVLLVRLVLGPEKPKPLWSLLSRCTIIIIISRKYCWGTILMSCDLRLWSCKTQQKVTQPQTSQCFTENVRAKVLSVLMQNNFPTQNNSLWHKYVMYFYLVTYFLIPIFYLSVWFRHGSILKIFPQIDHIHYFPSKNGILLCTYDL